jgi:protein arginine kinase activator
MQCDLCQAPATVHLTQIIHNKIHKVDLCEACAQKKGVTDPEGFSLADILTQNLAALSGKTRPETTLACDACGCTPHDFKEHGRLGCPACYEQLKTMLTPLLTNLHRDTRHVGKTPATRRTPQTLHKEIGRLRNLLAEAIREERYEDAARLRDSIEQINQDEALIRSNPS